MLFLKKLVVMWLAFLNFLPLEWIKHDDSCKAHEFPRIAAEKQEAGTLRVMSFNIRCADVNGVRVRRRIGIAVRQIKEVLPDVLGLQEVTPEWMRALDWRLGLYAWVGMDRETGGSPKKNGESCPIFYLKSKFTLEDSGSFWLSETPDEPSFGPGAACKRVCTWAKLRDKKTGEVFVHVNTHFDHVSEEARAAGGEIVTKLIEERFSEIPVVFTADVNAQRDEQVYATMTKTLKDAGLTAEEAEPFGTFHACSPETHADYVIDFILCSEDIGVRSYRVVTKGVDERFVSDHFPLYADVVLPG